jgi:hypothetical protein
MKRLILSFVGIICLCILACSKKDISGDSSNLVLGSYITLDSVISNTISISNPASAASIMIGKYVGTPVSSVNIFVATASNAEDTTGWKYIKAQAYSNGAVLSVSTAELAKALGASPVSGKKYTLQNQVVTTDGRKFSTYNTPDTYNSFPAYNMALTWYAKANP